jgi:hypothetical protein
MRALVNRKVTNKNVKSNNVLAKFLYPPIFNGDLIVLSDLYVNGTTHLTNLDVSGNLYVAENVDVSGNLVLDGSLDVSGNFVLDGSLDVSGNITSDQSIVAQKFVTGQIANMQILNKTDIGQAGTITIDSAATGTLFTYSYTPKCANSYIVVEYQTKYAFGGAGADSLTAYAIVNDGSDRTVGQTYQQWVNTMGGGTRSGTIFPIVGRYSNGNKTAKNIIVKLQNDTDSDQVTVTGDDIMTFLKITEIGKSSTPS